MSAVTIMPILGCTWVIGLFAINEDTEVFAWIFTILNSLQVHIIVLVDLIEIKFMFMLLGVPHIFLLCIETRKG